MFSFCNLCMRVFWCQICIAPRTCCCRACWDCTLDSSVLFRSRLAARTRSLTPFYILYQCRLSISIFHVRSEWIYVRNSNDDSHAHCAVCGPVSQNLGQPSYCTFPLPIFETNERVVLHRATAMNSAEKQKQVVVIGAGA